MNIKHLLWALFLAVPGISAERTLTEVDQVKFFTCTYDDKEGSVSCLTHSRMTQKFPNVYSQCQGSDQPGTGERLGKVKKDWGSACTLWQNEPMAKKSTIGSHRKMQ